MSCAQKSIADLQRRLARLDDRITRARGEPDELVREREAIVRMIEAAKAGEESWLTTGYQSGNLLPVPQIATPAARRRSSKGARKTPEVKEFADLISDRWSMNQLGEMAQKLGFPGRVALYKILRRLPKGHPLRASRAFATWLQKTTGWQLDPDQIRED